MPIIKPFNATKSRDAVHPNIGPLEDNWNRQAIETLPNKKQITACNFSWGHIPERAHKSLRNKCLEPASAESFFFLHGPCSMIQEWCPYPHIIVLLPEDCGSSSSNAASKLRPMGVGTICLVAGTRSLKAYPADVAGRETWRKTGGFNGKNYFEN